MSSTERGGPVFILTMHRAGGTVLARILNTHPGLVVWGEHVGLINQLAKIDVMVNQISFMMDRKTDADIADYARFPDHRLNDFDPWANAFDYDSFRESCRTMIERIFARGLAPGQRWGFKEIRYHTVQTVRFLEKLFPTARFVILRRNIEDVAVSGILAPWSLLEFPAHQAHMPEALATDIVRDVTYALLAIETGLDAIEAHLGARCMALRYEQLLDRSRGFVRPLFDFCRLDLPIEVEARIAGVLAEPAGGTDKSASFGGILSSAWIRAKSAELAPALREEIRTRGIDRNRLLARAGVGRFSFLAGDHHMHDGGTGVSSLFDLVGDGGEFVAQAPEPPATAAPQTRAKRLAIIIPYRDRPNHLAKFLPHLISYFHRHPDADVASAKIVVVEQADALPFNRGALLNAGFLAVEGEADAVCFHDVDYIPMWADYSPPEAPTRIVWWGMHARPIRVGDPGRQTIAPRVGLGAVSLFPAGQFRAVNGYSNRFSGWGFEDTDLAARCGLQGLTVGQRDGTFIPLDHDNAGYRDDGSQSPAWTANEKRFIENQRDYTLHGAGREGLSSFAAATAATTLRVTGLDAGETAEVTHLAVSLASRAEPKGAELACEATLALMRGLRPSQSFSVIVPGAAETARAARPGAPARSAHAASAPRQMAQRTTTVPRRQTICLAMIVKNEAPVIARCLASVLPLIDHWIVVDTGSTDGTQDIVRGALAGVPGALHERPWVDFAQNRSEALALARPHADYSFVIDADDVLEIPPGFRLPFLKQDAVSIEIAQQERRYWRPQLVRNDLAWRYEGVLHEFLSLPEDDSPAGRVLPEQRSQRRLPGVKIVMSEEGARRRMAAAPRFRADAEVLRAALRTETDAFLTARYAFYLGEALRDAGAYEEAIAAYEARARLGGWDQEVFISLLRAAGLMAELGRAEDDVIGTFLRAHAACPGRAEALHGAARFCRLRERFAQGFEIAQRGLRIALPADALFVEPWIYEYGLLDEYAVTAYWVGRYDACLEACRRLLATKALPVEERERVQANMEFSVRKMSEKSVTQR